MSFSNLLVFFNGAVRTTIDTVCHAIDCKQGSKMVRHCALCFRCQWGFRLAAILIKVGLVNQNMVFRFSKTAVLALTVPAVKFLALLAINYGLVIVPFVQTRCTQKVVIINRVISAHFKHFHKLSDVLPFAHRNPHCDFWIKCQKTKADLTNPSWAT